MNAAAGADEQSSASEVDVSWEGAMEEPVVALPSVVIVAAVPDSAG